MDIKNEVIQKFGNRLRLRVCGICYEEERVLMIKHKGVGPEGYLWSPPGGGVEFGSSLSENLIREFKEETGLEIQVLDFMFAYELLQPPFHAVELFFRVKRLSGKLKTGYDPEMNVKDQIIENAIFMGADELAREQGPQMHSVFQGVEHPKQILNLKGYFNFENNYIK
ncbi:MAG: NUDIX domain-containing protein [Cyclobacteriaceae bacterium]